MPALRLCRLPVSLHTCRSQVETTKRNLEDAKRRLGTTSRSLQQQARPVQGQQFHAHVHRPVACIAGQGPRS